MEHEDGAIGLVLCRQNIPELDRSTAKGDVSRGGYILAEASGGAPKVILMATGSELHVAVAARQKLEAEGIATRVVSMPCWEFFDAQPREYREMVLPHAVKARLSIEAGRHAGMAEVRRRRRRLDRRRPLRRLRAGRRRDARVRLHGRARREVCPGSRPQGGEGVSLTRPRRRAPERGGNPPAGNPRHLRRLGRPDPAPARSGDRPSEPRRRDLAGFRDHRHRPLAVHGRGVPRAPGRRRPRIHAADAGARPATCRRRSCTSRAISATRSSSSA